jgi:tight adherence protein B
LFLLLSAIAIVGLFLPFIFLAGRVSDEKRRMRARFAMLQTGGAGGLSASNQINLLKNIETESASFFETKVVRLSTHLKLDSLLLQANSQQTLRGLFQWCILAAGAAILAVSLGAHSLIGALIAGILAFYAPILLLKARAGRRTLAMNKALPEVLDMMSRALRAGHSMPAAIGIVAEGAAEPAGSAFGEVFQQQKFGLPMRDSLSELVLRFPSQDLKVLVTAILVQRDSGGNLVQILDRTSTVIRERLKLQGEVRVHTAQGRLTGWILCLLPILMLAMLALTNPAYVRILIDDPVGRKLLYGAAFLLCLGGYLINRIVKAIEV